MNSGYTGLTKARFPSKPQITRVPFFLPCSVLIRRPPNKKGKRVLLGYLERQYRGDPIAPATVSDSIIPLTSSESSSPSLIGVLLVGNDGM